MADNIDVDPGTAVSKKAVATDEVAGAHYQRVKVVWGADGVANDANAATPLPVVQTGTPGLPTGAATETTLAAVAASVDTVEALLGTSNTNTGATTTAIGNISKAEDAAHSSGDLGIMGLGVRKDTATALAGTDGDYQPAIYDANGRLHAAAALYLGATAVTAGAGAVASGTPRVTLASDDPGVVAIGGVTTELASVHKAEDAVHSSGDKGIMALSVRKDTATALAGADGDYAALETDASGRLHVNVGTAAQLPTALATGGGLKVTVQDTSGTALDYTIPALVGGDIAHDSPISTQKPVVIGGRAATANPTAVADADVSRVMLDKLGKLVAVSALRELKGVQTTTITSSTSETTIVTAAGSGVFADIYGLILTNTSASAQIVTIKDATAGTTRATIEVPAGDTRGFMLDAGSAFTQNTANNNWTATCTTSLASLYVTVLYVKNL